MVKNLFDLCVSLTRLRSEPLLHALKAHLVDGVSNKQASLQYHVDKSSISRAANRVASIARRVTRRTVGDLVSLFSWRNSDLKRAVQRRLSQVIPSSRGPRFKSDSNDGLLKPSLSRAFSKVASLQSYLNQAMPIGGDRG